MSNDNTSWTPHGVQPLTLTAERLNGAPAILKLTIRTDDYGSIRTDAAQLAHDTVSAAIEQAWTEHPARGQLEDARRCCDAAIQEHRTLTQELQALEAARAAALSDGAPSRVARRVGELDREIRAKRAALTDTQCGAQTLRQQVEAAQATARAELTALVTERRQQAVADLDRERAALLEAVLRETGSSLSRLATLLTARGSMCADVAFVRDALALMAAPVPIAVGAGQPQRFIEGRSKAVGEVCGVG